MTLSFFSRIRKSGGSLIITVPYHLIKHEDLTEGSKVWVILRKYGAVRIKAVRYKKRLK